MEIIYRTQERTKPSVCKTQSGRRIRELEFTVWKEETRRKKLETQSWLLKRGYWKPDTPACLTKLLSGVRRPKLVNRGFRISVMHWPPGYEKFIEEIRYRRQYQVNPVHTLM